MEKEKSEKINNGLVRKIDNCILRKESNTRIIEQNQNNETQDLFDIYRNKASIQVDINRMERDIDEFEQKKNDIGIKIKTIGEKIGDKEVGEKQFFELKKKLNNLSEKIEKSNDENVRLELRIEESKENLSKKKELSKEKKELDEKLEILLELKSVLKGNRFVEFLAIRKLKYIAKEATEMLKKVSKGRYFLEIDDNGDFQVVDNFNGGIRRSTKTLSGGETFLVSLSLAISLSTHLQLKGGIHLDFFFLDEGFGTLDSALLETVMDSLESLYNQNLKVGLITHVEEIKSRIPRKLIVKPALSGVRGSKIELRMD